MIYSKCISAEKLSANHPHYLQEDVIYGILFLIYPQYSYGCLLFDAISFDEIKNYPQPIHKLIKTIVNTTANIIVKAGNRGE